MWDNVTNWNHYISTATLLMAIKIDRVVTYLEVHLPQKPYDSLISREELKIIVHYIYMVTIKYSLLEKFLALGLNLMIKKMIVKEWTNQE